MTNEKKVELKVHGREFVGVVTSDKMSRTVTVAWDRRQFIPKYERYEKKLSKVKAHNPESINAKEGDKVRIKECRPLSKTKNFVVIEILK
jgi:small subunit ribosomal protein S17